MTFISKNRHGCFRLFQRVTGYDKSRGSGDRFINSTFKENFILFFKILNQFPINLYLFFRFQHSFPPFLIVGIHNYGMFV